MALSEDEPVLQVATYLTVLSSSLLQAMAAFLHLFHSSVTLVSWALAESKVSYVI